MGRGRQRKTNAARLSTKDFVDPNDKVWPDQLEYKIEGELGAFGVWGFSTTNVPLAIGDRICFFVRRSYLKIGAQWVGAAVAHYTVATPPPGSDCVVGPYSVNDHDPRVVTPKSYPWIVNFDLASGCSYFGSPKRIGPNAPPLKDVVTEALSETDFGLLIRRCK